ncbi:serine /threonine protein kinase [Haloferula helveola]|uniref:Serine /threonine protein kinase n=1 Tax=Haloferula helveola TaxID=490095 RepID=A0ABM7RC23_9BACT|nr:serine /threonine protein kinase [Haloferula helveola]
MRNLCLSLTIGALGAGCLIAADWPAWRGPNQNGSVEIDSAPSKFAGDKGVLWKAELPGRACSTPIVAKERIFVSAPIDGKDGLVAFDMQGKELWRTSLGKIRPGRGQRVGSSANSSPVTDGESVFAYFKSGELAAFDFEGKLLWKTNLFERFGEDKLWWDVGTSPVLAGGRVVVSVMQTDGNSYMVSFDKKSGEVAWKVDREFDTAKESGDSYTTPLVLDLDGKETIVNWGADHLTGHAADDGSLLWTCGGFNPEKVGMWRVIASAVATDGIAVVPYARGGQLAGVKLGGSGDITDSAFLWKKKDLGTDAASPAAHDGKVYLLTDSGKDRGQITCLDAKSGDVLWESKLPKGAQIYYSSPVLAGNVLYCVREDGVLFAAKVTDEGLEDIVEVETGQSVIASPVVLDGKLLIRGDRSLICYGNP